MPGKFTIILVVNILGFHWYCLLQRRMVTSHACWCLSDKVQLEILIMDDGYNLTPWESKSKVTIVAYVSWVNARNLLPRLMSATVQSLCSRGVRWPRGKRGPQEKSRKGDRGLLTYQCRSWWPCASGGACWWHRWLVSSRPDQAAWWWRKKGAQAMHQSEMEAQCLLHCH